MKPAKLSVALSKKAGIPGKAGNPICQRFFTSALEFFDAAKHIFSR
tara:strand:- start:252 stop:389 length:138 start_codon:yes stop_codon:yes gene_type:complete